MRVRLRPCPPARLRSFVGVFPRVCVPAWMRPRVCVPACVRPRALARLRVCVPACVRPHVRTRVFARLRACATGGEAGVLAEPAVEPSRLPDG